MSTRALSHSSLCVIQAGGRSIIVGTISISIIFFNYDVIFGDLQQRQSPFQQRRLCKSYFLHSPINLVDCIDHLPINVPSVAFSRFVILLFCYFYPLVHDTSHAKYLKTVKLDAGLKGQFLLANEWDLWKCRPSWSSNSIAIFS